jgi:hypothetical protein
MNAISSSEGFDPVIHEIPHNEKMNNLGDHEPMADIVV